MKRFWTEVATGAEEGGFSILLDGRPVRTPRRAPLLVPTAALAGEIAAEWAAVGERVTPGEMVLTGLANAAIDLVAPDPAGFATGLAAYAASDLTCYRAEGPATLVTRQAAAFEPLLKGVEARLGLIFRRTAGVQYVEQPAETLEKVQAHLARLPPFRLAGLSPLVTISGSVVIALAIDSGLTRPEAGLAAAHADEEFQAERWGRDPEAEARRAAQAREFLAAARFLSLLSGARRA